VGISSMLSYIANTTQVNQSRDPAVAVQNFPGPQAYQALAFYEETPIVVDKSNQKIHAAASNQFFRGTGPGLLHRDQV